MADLDVLFDTYARMLPELMEWARARYPKEAGDSDFVYKQTIKAKACDAARGILPAATLSNVGIYGTGQAFEALLLRMRAHPLPEAQQYAAMMLHELRKVIPSFLTRVDRPERGGAWTEYLAGTRQATAEVVDRLLRRRRARAAPGRGPHRLRSGRRGEAPGRRVLPAHEPSRGPDPGPGTAPLDRRARGPAPRRTWGSGRTGATSRAGPSNAPTTGSTSSCDYGAFRDLQRHRMLTIEWQPLSPAHGYDVPEAVAEAGLARPFEDAMAVSAALHDALAPAFPEQAPYAVSLAYRVRFAVQMNAREAMHMLELRTSPQVIPRTVVSARRCTA